MRKVIVAATTSEATVTSPSVRYCNSEYSTTSTRPMRPASSPLCNWLAPRVAEMLSLLCTLKPIGRAPNLS